jgi:hypothetical protein
VAFVASVKAASCSILLIKANSGGMNVAGFAGGVPKTNPTAPESKSSGDRNSQNAEPFAASPASKGKLA